MSQATKTAPAATAHERRIAELKARTAAAYTSIGRSMWAQYRQYFATGEAAAAEKLIMENCQAGYHAEMRALLEKRRCRAITQQAVRQVSTVNYGWVKSAIR